MLFLKDAETMSCCRWKTTRSHCPFKLCYYPVSKTMLPILKKKKKKIANLPVYFPLLLLWGGWEEVRIGVIADHFAGCLQVCNSRGGGWGSGGKRRCVPPALRAEWARVCLNSIAVHGGEQTAVIILQVPLEINPCY